MEHQVIVNMDLEIFFFFLELVFHKLFIYLLLLLFFKFDRLIPTAAFREPYSGVLNGTRSPWTQVRSKFFFFFFYFDRSIPIAAFREPYSGVLYGTRAPWTRVPCKFIFYFLSLIAPYSIFYKSSFTLKLNFEKIEFQNRGISLISLGKGAKRWFFLHGKGICLFWLGIKGSRVALDEN